MQTSLGYLFIALVLSKERFELIACKQTPDEFFSFALVRWLRSSIFPFLTGTLFAGYEHKSCQCRQFECSLFTPGKPGVGELSTVLLACNGQ